MTPRKIATGLLAVVTLAGMLAVCPDVCATARAAGIVGAGFALLGLWGLHLLAPAARAVA